MSNDERTDEPQKNQRREALASDVWTILASGADITMTLLRYGPAIVLRT